MIRLRDEQIAALEADRAIGAQTLANTRMELEQMREMYNEETMWLGLKVQALDREREALQEENTLLNQQMTAEALIANYAKIIKKSRFKRAKKTYVADLEAELYKAMHKVEVMSKQLELIRAQCKKDVDATKEEMGAALQDKVRTESELRSKLVQAEQENKRIESDCKTRLHHREETIENLQFDVDRLNSKIDALEQRENTYEKALDKALDSSRHMANALDSSRHKAPPIPSGSTHGGLSPRFSPRRNSISSPRRNSVSSLSTLSFKTPSFKTIPTIPKDLGNLTSSDISSDEESTFTPKRGDLIVSGWEDKTVPTKADLSEIFETSGPLSNVDVYVKEKFAVISYVKSNHAKKAVKKYHNVAKIAGHVLNVRLSPPVVLTRSDVLIHGWSAKDPIQRKDLLGIFAPFGLVHKITFGECNDYAIVTYKNQFDAQKAAHSLKYGAKVGDKVLQVVRRQ